MLILRINGYLVVSRESVQKTIRFVAVKTPRRRLTCRGDLARAARRAHLLATFLWELVNDAAAMVSRTSSSDPHSSYYVIERGMGKRVREGEAWAWWKGESIISVATMKQMERENKTQHKVEEGKFSLLACRQWKCIQWEWRLSQHDLSFIPSPFEGRLNPKTALRHFSPIPFLLVAHGLDKWITNMWAKTMLLA